MTKEFRPLSIIGRIASTLFGVLFGAAFVGAGLWIQAGTQPLDDGVIVVGVVVDVDQRTDSDGDRTYAPIVDYVDPATGITHRITGSVSSSSRPDIGSSKDVSLRPGEPSSARVVGPAWFGWIFIITGATCIVGVVVLPIFIRRAAGRNEAGRAESGAGAGGGAADHEWTIESDTSTPAPKRSTAHRPPVGVVQPGYHPDPDDNGRIRYWDGSAWTDMYAPTLFDD